MRVTIICIGRQKAGPEVILADDYAERFRKTGRRLGYRALDFIDVDSGGGAEAEGSRALQRAPSDARLVRLEEDGRAFASAAFSTHLASLRDDGLSDLCFLIGGADGHGETVRQAVPDTLGFGVQTWPHRLVRVMLAEQLYRAASLEAGLPYHKA